MPDTKRFYRFRIRAADNLSDALVITSVPGGTNPYLVKPFNGDGRSFDPLTGEVTTGAYTVEVIDALTAPNTRVVTAALADAGARQQLLSRKSFGETSVDGVTWVPLFGGYVNSVRMVSAIKFSFAIGETRRISANREVFKSTALTVDFSGKPATFSVFDKVTCIFGGPIRGGWMSLRDFGGWRFRVTQVHSSPNYVQMKLLRAFDPTKPEHGTFSTLSTAIVDAMTARARSYYRESPRWKASTIRGYFPGIIYRVQSTTGTLVGNFTPLSEPVHPDKATAPDIFTRNGEAAIWVDWTAAVPSVGDQYDVYMYPTDISVDNPLHIFEHPVDLRQKLWDESGIAYDASVLPAVRSAIGDEIRLALRITQSPGKLKDFEATLNGLFGMATRSNGSGAEVLFTHRIKLATTPVTVVTLDDLRDTSESPFELDEATVTNKVTIKQKRLFPRLATDESTVDGIIAVDQAISVNNSDADTTAYGDQETIYQIEGQIVMQNAQQDFDLEKYTLGVAREIFDRWGRGAIGGGLACLPSVTADVGDEIQVNIPQLPNAQVGAVPVSQRGGTRIVQIVRRTELPSGADLYVLDSGTTAQPGTAPTFTIVPNVDDPFHFADLVITNALTLAGLGYMVRIEIGVGAVAPAAGSLLTNVDPSKLALSMASLSVAQAAALSVAQAAAYSSSLPGFTIPAHDSGTKVWARMRSEKEGYRPSAFTAFAGAQLTALNAVTGLAVSAENAGDPSQRLLTWAIGANAADYPVEVYIRLSSESAAADRLIAILPKGSTQYLLTELDASNRTATVKHREKAPFNGASALSTIAVNTVGAAATLGVPHNPVAFAGRHLDGGSLVPDGTYGIDVNAAVFPCGIEIAVAVGAGAFETREIVPAAPFGPTRWIGTAPNDGQIRHIKARHVRQGYTSSPYCAEVTVVPWSPTALFRAVFKADGSAMLVDPVTGEITAEASLADGVKQTSAGASRAIAKGYQSGLTQDLTVVTFSPVYQNPPQVLMRGGKDGGAGTYPLYQADGLTGAGFTCSARIITKGVITPQVAEFTAPVAVSAAGSTVGPASIGGAAAYDNNYTVRFGISVTITIPSGGGHTDVVVAVETNDGVHGWIERATRSFSASRTSGAGTTVQPYTLQQIPINDSTLGAADQIRLKLKSITVVGPGGSSGAATLTGYDNTGGNGHGLLYNTNSGGSNVTKTPDVDDFIFWESFEVTS